MLKLRPAAAADAAQIIRVRREAILAKAASHYDECRLTDWVADAADHIARIRREIADPAVIVLVAEAGGEIVGFAVAAPSENTLRALYAQPNDIGGVGHKLLASIEAIAFESTPFLTCEASLNAENFYRANGYREECRKNHVSPNGITSPVVQMRKPHPA